jgi:hypothetical protein
MFIDMADDEILEIAAKALPETTGADLYHTVTHGFSP